MDDGDGAFTLELQAKKISDSMRGSAPCPQCAVIMNPVEFMYSLGLCQSCDNDRRNSRIKNRLI
jgi:hypothetical protein